MAEYQYVGVLKEKQEVNLTDKTVSVILAGGLGNIMFQMATVLSYCKDKGLDPLLGYWTSHQTESSRWSKRLNRYARNHHFEPWGGHPMKEKAISMDDIFPKLPWFNSRPNAFDWWFYQDTAYDWDTGKGGVFYELDEVMNTPFLMQGYFFNYQYWHHNREYLLDMFSLNEEYSKWLDFHFKPYFDSDTISLHLRMGSDHDFMQPDTVPPSWVQKKLEDLIEEDTRVLVFSDNLGRARKMIESFDMPVWRFIYIDEDAYVCMELMSRCNKHILSNSTLSFWGAYLDKVENNPHTYLHKSFLKNHPKEMIPYENWKIEDYEDN